MGINYNPQRGCKVEIPGCVLGLGPILHNEGSPHMTKGGTLR